MAKKKYADGMLASLQELTGKQALSTYTPTQVAEAWAEQQSQLKAGLQSLQQEIAANEQDRRNSRKSFWRARIRRGRECAA